MPKSILAEFLSRRPCARPIPNMPGERWLPFRAASSFTNTVGPNRKSPGGLLMPSATQQQQKPVVQIWKSYKKSASKELRNQLIEYYLPLVRNHAERLKAKLPSVVQVDDLTTAGVLGLMDAIEQFDPDRKVKFETFSAIRIRGAMMDELRGLDWVPRLVRQRAKMLSEATAHLRSHLGRQPSEEEVCAHLNVTPTEYERIAGDSQPANVYSIYGKRTNNN